MNFDLSEDQVLLAEMVGRMLGDHAANDRRDPGAEWRDCLGQGLIALPFAEDQGGLGGGHEEVMLMMEAIGRNLSQTPYLQSVLLAGRVLALAGRMELGDLLDGAQRHCLCLYEPGQRYRWATPATRAERCAEGWSITGAKVSVPDLDDTCALIVPAATAEGLVLFLLPPGISGVTLDIRPAPDGRTAANVNFASVIVPVDAAIGDPAGNEALLAEALDGAVLASCAESIGAMERLLDLTVEYCNIREQFGAVIGSFQALQHRAADMLIAIERARSITIYAASMMDAPAARRSVAVSAARALVNRSSRFVGQQAIQLHGGIGLASECAAGAYFQRLTVLETLLGDTEHHVAAVERSGGLLAA